MIDGEEKKLVLNAINGEASAFGSLYDRYQSKIYRFIYLKVGHREEAEDLCHQVFLSAWQNIANYKFKGFSFSAWIYSIARNKIIDYYRTKKNHQNVDDFQIIIDGGPNTDLDDKIKKENLKKAIAKLSQIEQDIIILRFVEDLNLKEAAEILKISEILLRVRQHRAIKKLGKILNIKDEK
ncbi:sigma-70 family RNA polymerase sigma factor [Candidatus Wolfebacteria bacterium]|nr:sigma-70 family RNA polymerase sigma factor [Candidatus Wolfebacteria bacterium]